jgi:hypothetical protein
LGDGELRRKKMLQVIGSVFTGSGKFGDFAWMIRQAEYADALFVFNDNEEQFRAHRQDPKNPYGCSAGGGNAVIRPYQCHSPPRAIGIPTGTRGQGYAALTDDVRRTIDDAIRAIEERIAVGHYQWLFYSAANSAGELGTGIFEVHPSVKQYIVDRLKALAPLA